MTGYCVASFVRSSDNRILRLGGTNIIGRDPACDLILTDPRVSQLHARVTFEDNVWSFDDLASRNGSWVNGQRVTPGTLQLLAVGDRIRLGSSAEEWRVASLDAPTLFARAPDGETIPGSDYLCLPNSDEPEITIFERADGQWIAERADIVLEVGDRHTVVVQGIPWRVCIPDASTRTVEDEHPAPGVSELSLAFAVSADEEHVQLTVIFGTRHTELKARTHHYLLLALARARLADQQDSTLSAASHGWLYQDTLCRMLRIDDNAVYLAVHRARRQLEAAGVARAADLVERRSTTRQLRIGVASLSVRRL